MSHEAERHKSKPNEEKSESQHLHSYHKDKLDSSWLAIPKKKEKKKIKSRKWSCHWKELHML